MEAPSASARNRCGVEACLCTAAESACRMVSRIMGLLRGALASAISWRRIAQAVIPWKILIDPCFRERTIPQTQIAA